MIKLKLAPGPHVNLLIPDQSIYSNEFIEGIYVQGIRGKGYVAEHDHSTDGVSEIIQPSSGSFYAGLDNERILKAGDAHIVKKTSGSDPVYPTHGSLNEPSFGQWLAFKIFDKEAEHKYSSVIGGYNSSVYHVLEKNQGEVNIAISGRISVLERIIQDPELIIGLPLIKELREGVEYNPYFAKKYDHLNNQLGRYLVISKR